jgi:hypothetical protein
LQNENRALRKKISELELLAKQSRVKAPNMTGFGQAVLRKCKLENMTIPSAVCSDRDASCWRSRAKHLENDLLVQAIRSTMCMTTAARCRPNPMTRTEESERGKASLSVFLTCFVKGCQKLRFDPENDKFDIVLSWINFTESGYFGKPDFFGSLRDLQPRYGNV